MYSTDKRHFYYHADANAFGGVFKQPIDRIVSSPASVSLAQAGGSGHSRVDRFRVDGVLSCESASVSTFGYYDAAHDAWRTIVKATIDKINILDIFTADRIVSQMSVSHPRNSDRLSISLAGSQYANVLVAGVQVRPTISTGMLARPVNQDERGGEECKNLTHDAAVPTVDDLIAIAEEQRSDMLPPPYWLGNRLAGTDPRRDLEEKGSALCSLVSEVAADWPAQTYMHALHVPDFGNIFLGELLVGRTSFHLTMARIEMGCAGDGEISIGTSFTNGRLMP